MKNNQFSFVVRCYNQEKYILQNLESIKYLCESYGNGMDIHFFLCDDHSTDNSVAYARKWLEVNKGLFSKIVINVNEENLGIVYNQLKAVELVDTERFKITDADDLYFTNNVFSIKDADIVCTPMLIFEDNKVYRDKSFEDRFKLLLLHSADLFSYLKERISYDYIIHTPGMFFKMHLFDDVCRRNMQKYKWIDDVVQFYSFMQNNSLNIQVDMTPYILYRYNVGISTSTRNTNAANGNKEIKIIDREIFTNRTHSKIWQHFNYKYYKYSIEKRMLQFVYCRSNAVISKFNQEFAKCIKDAQNHLDHINERAEEFFRNTNRND